MIGMRQLNLTRTRKGEQQWGRNGWGSSGRRGTAMLTWQSVRPSSRWRSLLLASSTTTTTTFSFMAACTRTIINDKTYRLHHSETTVGEGDLTTPSPFKRQRRTLMTMAAEVSSSSSSAAASMKEGFANYALYLNELVQEYVEAAILCKFCKTGVLLNLEEINASLRPLSEPAAEPLHINVLDYILGLADLTGELMRLAIGRISDGELEYAQRICKFVRDIYRELTLVVPLMDDNFEMKKMDTMLQSVLKIETACFSVHVRGSEYIPLLGSEDTNYALFSTTDFEQ